MPESKLREFHQAIENLDIETGIFDGRYGGDEIEVTPSLGVVETDYGLAGYVNYSIVENFGESRRVETYVPGILDEGRFLPVIWDDVERDIERNIRDILDEPGEEVNFWPKEYYYSGDFSLPQHLLPGPSMKLFNEALTNYDLEMRQELGEDKTGFYEQRMIPDTIDAGGLHYGYIERRKIIDNGDEASESSRIDVLGEIVPGPDIEPVKSRDKRTSVRLRLSGELKSVEGPEEIYFLEELE